MSGKCLDVDNVSNHRKFITVTDNMCILSCVKTQNDGHTRCASLNFRHFNCNLVHTLAMSDDRNVTKSACAEMNKF